MASSNLWHKLGLTIAKWADQNFLLGVGQLTSDVYNTIRTATPQAGFPINWNFEFHRLYIKQESVLWVKDEDKKRSFLPQVIVIGPSEYFSESSICVDLTPNDFQAPLPVNAGFEFYASSAESGERILLFDGTGARLLEWDAISRKLTFQGNSFFDYLKTNLSLDVPLPVIGTLREYLAKDGRIEPLNTSKLANVACVNGLIFSNDGYMIFQRRGKNVLIRPNELCSGFSGMINKIDIVHAVEAGGSLAKLDILREMNEELGIRREEVVVRRFLGLTRELIRAGAPEFFYSVDVDLPVTVILSRISKDNEGSIISTFFGPFASSFLKNREDASALAKHFWKLTESIQRAGNCSISIPFLTNLVLWYQCSNPIEVGVASLPSINNFA